MMTFVIICCKVISVDVVIEHIQNFSSKLRKRNNNGAFQLSQGLLGNFECTKVRDRNLLKKNILSYLSAQINSCCFAARHLVALRCSANYFTS